MQMAGQCATQIGGQIHAIIQLEPKIQNEKFVSIELPCMQEVMTLKKAASDPDGFDRFVRRLTH
jgi:hypothetical protein